MKGEEIMISVLSYDMLNIANISEILGLYKNGYVHIEPKVKKVSIIDLGIEKKDIIALSNFNFSINIFSSKFNLNQLISLNSDAYILWGVDKHLENIDCLLEKVKKLIGKKTLIGIGSGKQVLKTLAEELEENTVCEENGIKRNDKYKIYLLNDNDIGKINEII